MEANIYCQIVWQPPKSRVPPLPGWFRKPVSIPKALQFPKIIRDVCNGILFGNVPVKTILFSTDLALIENNDADAVLAVYPFPPSAKIMQSLINFSGRPVICGVGGGITQGKTAAEMAVSAEGLGASALIVNQPFKNKHIERIRKLVSIPIISSVSVSNFNFRDRINAGVDIFHVTGGNNTVDIINHLTYAAPCFPVMATGGKSMDDLKGVVNAGADAVVLTPPSSGELFRVIMDKYRMGINYLKK
ncbi:MAG: hypothetical protein QM786_14490 [Breznakibacter sp.]